MKSSARSLRVEFAAFAVALALPLVALIAYSLYARTRDEFAAAESLARRTAEASADRVADYAEGLRSSLNALAKRPLIKAMDAARCDPRLADLADLYPRAASFTVINPQGEILCSSSPLPRGRVMRLTDEDLLRELRAQPRFLIHKPVVSRLRGGWVVGAVHPVMGDDGALAGAVAVATDLAQWQPFPPPEALPAGTLITIVTGDGTIIAQSEKGAEWIGRRIWDEGLMQRVLATRDGVLRAKGPFGIDRIYGIKPVAGLPWFVLAGLEEDGVLAPARQRMAETAALLVLIVALVALLLHRMIESGARAQAALARQAERLRIVHEIDAAIIGAVKPEAIAAAVLPPLRELLGVPRAIVNLIDSASGEVQWLAAAGRHRVRVGGVRYASNLMGDVDGLRRGEPQRIEVGKLAAGPEVDALLASGVHFYMAVPMIAGGELIGALSFGGEKDAFPSEQVEIAQEVASQLAIALAQARLFERVQRHAEELEERVRERTLQLEAANKELESFTYSVSHDLRAPVRAVDGYARMLQEDHAPQLDAEGRRLLEVVRANSRQMGQLIDDLLAFSKLGRQEPAKRSVDMAALVQEVIGGINGNASARIETLGLPPAQADRALLKQVWLNLVSNALKYSGKKPDARIEIGGRQEGGEKLYWVRDNGVGFDMRYAGKLFGVFQRLHGQSEFPGTGVGLAIVQRVVSRHGGRVWAEARPDEGACFYFTLPGAP